MPKDPGSSLSTARSLKFGQTTRTVRDSLSVSDHVDIWKFNLRQNASFNLGLTGLARRAKAKLSLLNATGQVIQTVNQRRDQPQAFTDFLLPAGRFYIRVDARSKVATRYRLNVSASEIGEEVGDQYGNSFETATQLRSSTGSLRDFVGNSDPTDFLQFTPLVTGQLTLNLSGLSSNASLELYDARQNLLFTAETATKPTTNPATNALGTKSLNQQLTAIAGSTYYLRVAQAPNQDTGYQLDYAYQISSRTQTASGLEYIDIATGTGVTPTVGQTVTVQYTGILFNGFKFDSSRDRNQPFSFQIGTGQVIAGWDEGISSMRVGGRRQLIIPAALAYGSRPAGSIPPNSNLIFDVEVLSIS
ncbi:MAG: FKBP-type peptidyl-prolyl cis-trans isomerase [Pegethrix bostrychoides GSE-TBD4-15B]|jgi:peptidylprolyl isomerase|uniref:peptidylprolyl isomerase n=1 Tax=Pegethrix bostrychoides GSE-TBD4-15B TaxID=2839662 RepID=A0A951U319_9CYAN|nr:FKBP-type peptidyl-prolyl cis-trans isomerase [Pegethrix bostrychoides GSE-TBD4-15B]